MPKITIMTPARKQPDKDTYSGRFAIRLRELREKAGLTVEEVVEQMEIPRRTYYNWESSISVPPLEVFPELAAVLGTEPRSLLPKQ